MNIEFCRSRMKASHRHKIMRNIKLLGLSILVASVHASDTLANGQCPAIGQATSCSTLITINSNGSLSAVTDPSVQPFDGVEDVLVGVVNKSGATVFGVQLTGSGIFGLDGDGAQGGPYPGPGTSFSIQNSNSGVVNFDNGLNDQGFLWFSLEGAPSQVKLTSSVTIDPGHGFTCPSIGQDAGAVGVTNFPASNPPPGFLHEDDLTVAISGILAPMLSAAGYQVTTTKADVQSCPDFVRRGEKANNAKSNIFVSVHVNKPSSFLNLDLGSSVLYNSAKTSSMTLANLMVAQIASNLGVSNRGSVARDNLAVLKPTVTRMTAVIAETARLSGSDEQVMHGASAPANAASGIKAGLDAFLNQ
jgi:N-acetylmuramoyl-L-alanine amidase